MNLKQCFVFAIIVSLLVSGCGISVDEQSNEQSKYKGKKILYIDSYHEGYAWSDGITEGVLSVLDGTGVELRVHRMDTKNNPAEEFKEQAALDAKSVIEQFNPDVVIASDDNAFKYLIMPYYRSADLPFVFCGVNWDVSLYGAPYPNTAGIVEVVFLDKSVEAVRQYANGDKVGFIALDTLSEHKNEEYYKKYLGLNLVISSYVNTFQEWQQQLMELQDEVDILIIGIVESIEGFDEVEAEKFLLDNLKIPSVVEHDWMIQYGLLSYSKIAQEHGEWSANAALEILDGTNPSDIPVVTNKRGKLALNFIMAENMGVIFDPELIRNAEVVKRE